MIDQILSQFASHEKVSIVQKYDDIELEAEKLQAIGILVNEVMTNIMKYAFPGKARGEIGITATFTEGLITLIISDNGVGMPEEIDFKNTNGFGLLLIEALTKQLEGKIRIERGNGTKIILEFRG